MELSAFQFDRDTPRITVVLAGKPPLTIGSNEVEVSYFSGGPGGQNVNKHMNGVRLIYTIPEAYMKAHVKTRQLIATCIKQRSTEQNFREAFKVLFEKVRQYFYVPPLRRATRATGGSKRRRLEGKKHRSALKQSRRGGGSLE